MFIECAAICGAFPTADFKENGDDLAHAGNAASNQFDELDGSTTSIVNLGAQIHEGIEAKSKAKGAEGANERNRCLQMYAMALAAATKTDSRQQRKASEATQRGASWQRK